MAERPERRKGTQIPGAHLLRQLNDAQLLTLRSLEHFGWELKFIRKPLFQQPLPVVFDGARQQFAVIEEDGSLNENPRIKIRP